jgi:cyclopropane-fatty-acyl-phospholipid synthase
MSTALRGIPHVRSLGAAGALQQLVLKALSGMTVGALELRLPNGETHRFGRTDEAPSAIVTVERVDLFRRIALRPRLGLGESYVAGDWHADDLVALFEVLLRNTAAVRARPPLSTLLALERRLPRLPARQGRRQAERNIHYHYDIGNELYALFLDESLTYSCAYFERPDETLAQAQQNKYRRICDKLALSAEDHLLEIGCGWGGFAIHAARERGARVTGLTISREQLELAQKRVSDAGLAHRVQIVYRDYRAVEGQFTKIASIEMLEAIGHEQYGTFFAACDRLLAPGGIACIQTIAIPDQRYESYRRTRDWIQEYIFPGSLLPSLTALTNAMTRHSSLLVFGLEDIGIHYADTLRGWRERFLANIEQVRALGYDESFERSWEFYLAYCEAAFATRSLRDLQLVLTRSFNDRLPRYPAWRMSF